VVWQQSDGTRDNIWANRYNQAMGLWDTARMIETDNAGTAQNPQVSMDSGGDAVVVWQQSDGARYNIWSNRFIPASGWGLAQLVEHDNTGSAQSPQVAMDPGGNAIVVWQQSNGKTTNIWASRKW
jgi:hypothetical protein